MKTQVQLTADPLIEYWDFSKAIAHAICSASELELKGVDCIEGKLVTHQFAKALSIGTEEKWPAIAALQSVLLSDDGRTLEQLRPDQPEAAAGSTLSLPFGNELRHGVVEVTFQHVLSDDDRRLLEKLLAYLPELHYPMSEEEVATFMSAYFNLPNRPAWEPVLVTATALERRKAQHKAKLDEVMREHQQKLQDDLAQGRLVAVNDYHVPVTKLVIGAFLPRDQAIAYLNRCGIAYRDLAVSSQHDAEITILSIEKQPPESGQNAVGTPKLSGKEKKQAIVALHNELVAKGIKDPTQQVAEKFDVKDSYVRRLNREAKAEQDAGRIDRVWAKKRK